MLSASTNRCDSGRGDGPKRPATVTAPAAAIAVDPATRQFLDSDADPRWCQLLRYWQALAEAKGGLPARADIDPAAIGAHLLPNLFLVDVVTVPKAAKTRFRFRLLGQAIIERESTRPGDYLDEIIGTADLEEIERQYRACVAGRISLRRASLIWNAPRKDYIKYAVLMLPLADDGRTVTHLIGLAIYEV